MLIINFKMLFILFNKFSKTKCMFYKYHEILMNKYNYITPYESHSMTIYIWMTLHCQITYT